MWIEEEKKKAQNDCATKNIITFPLNLDEFFRISQYSCAKEMWDVLKVNREGTGDAKRVRKHAFT